MPDQNIDVDRVIEDMEAVPQTRERRMILALAYEVKALKGGGPKKSGGQKSGGQQGAKGQKTEQAGDEGGQQGSDSTQG